MSEEQSTMNNGAQVVPKYSSHWQVRITDPTEGGVDLLVRVLKSLFEDKYITYAIVGKSTGTDTRAHAHIALGTCRSVKPDTLRRKLKLMKREDIKAVCFSYHLSSVYNNSTAQSSWDYVKDNHEVIFEIGALDENKDTKVINLPLVFY